MQLSGDMAQTSWHVKFKILAHSCDESLCEKKWCVHVCPLPTKTTKQERGCPPLTLGLWSQADVWVTAFRPRENIDSTLVSRTDTLGRFEMYRTIYWIIMKYWQEGWDCRKRTAYRMYQNVWNTTINKYQHFVWECLRSVRKILGLQTLEIPK